MNQSQILTRISSHVNGDASLPEGDELTQFSDFLEESNQEWGNSYEYQSLIKTAYSNMPVSGFSAALPIDFKEKLAGYPLVNGSLFPELSPIEATFTSGDYVTWGGNQSGGYYINVSRPLTTGASLIIPYHSRAASFATLTSVSQCPDPDFLVNRTSEMILLQRGQPEYVEFQNKANLLLERMVANENTANVQRDRTIKTSFDRNNFTFGLD